MPINKFSGLGREHAGLLETVKPMEDFDPNYEFRFRTIYTPCDQQEGFMDPDHIAMDHSYITTNKEGVTGRVNDNRIAEVFFGGVYKGGTPRIICNDRYGILDEVARKVLYAFIRKEMKIRNG